MAKRKNVHVVPRNGGWAVRKEGNSRASSVHDTKREAVERAREMARNQSSELIIHRSDGRVSERDSYSPGPLPPKELRVVLFPKTLSNSGKKAIKEAVSEVVREARADSRSSSRAESR